ncbi:ABC transporter substrate-binding protein [Halocatena marina]|uniref:ABC transporter substrate-binding protein n=1 Tax=Halocatena marina TaxID=2934937 RepID=A0ABD5YMG4_9EURY|nr:ABC transporter substrate-binding protein [Halocatena marina]
MTDSDQPKRIGRIDRRKFIAGVGAGVATGLAGCLDSFNAPSNNSDNGSSGGNNSGGGSEGLLTFAQVKSPVEFDPVVLNDVPSDQVASLVFDPLYQFDKGGTNLVPRVAAKKPEVEKGGKRYIVELNTDATFQNGDPVTPEDVKYTFTAPVKEETENAGDFSSIKTVKTVDDSTVQFDLKYPFGAFDSYLAADIVPKSVRENDKKKFNTKQPIGAGPFKFAGWKEGNFVRVERWDDYWGDQKPNLSEIKFVPVEEGTTRVTTLKSGENDIIEEIPPKSWNTVKSISGASINSVPGVGYFYLAFNCNKGPTADPKVREAVDYTFSMDQAVSNFVEPTGIRQYSPLPEALASEWDMPVKKWKEIPHDKNIDKAKSMLDDSDNVPDNWNANIIVPPDDKREQLGTTVASGLKEAGYNASVQRLDWGAFLDKYVSGDPNDYNMYTLGWSGSPDPDSFMYFLFSQKEEGVGNGTFYRNDTVEKAITDARRSTDQNKRRKLYEKAITTLLEDRAHLPAYNLKNSFGVKSYVKDFTAHPVSSFSMVSGYNNVSVEK